MQRKGTTCKEIAQLKDSSPYKKATSVAKDGITLTSSKYIAAQDLILVKITLATGMQPAPLNNAKPRIEHGKKVVLVARHKRYKNGPAIVAMNKEIQDLMELWVNKIRHQRALPGN